MSGHIDIIGTIKDTKREGEIYHLIVEPEHLMDDKEAAQIMTLIVEKGSIGIDGISLTVVKVTEKNFHLTIIPETIHRTHLADKKKNDKVNLEFDMLGKYVQKAVRSILPSNPSIISQDLLTKMGY